MAGQARAVVRSRALTDACRSAQRNPHVLALDRVGLLLHAQYRGRQRFTTNWAGTAAEREYINGFECAVHACAVASAALGTYL